MSTVAIAVAALCLCCSAACCLCCVLNPRASEAGAYLVLAPGAMAKNSRCDEIERSAVGKKWQDVKRRFDEEGDCFAMATIVREGTAKTLKSESQKVWFVDENDIITRKVRTTKGNMTLKHGGLLDGCASETGSYEDQTCVF